MAPNAQGSHMLSHVPKTKGWDKSIYGKVKDTFGVFLCIYAKKEYILSR